MFGIGAIASGIISQVAGSAISGMAGNLLSSLMGQFGQGNVAGALSNLLSDSLGGALKGVVDNSILPGFMKEAAKSLIDNVLGNKQETTPECQCAVNDAFGSAGSAAAESMAKQIEENANESSKGKGAGNWLVALAQELANVQSKLIDKAMKNLDTMNSESDSQGKGAGQSSKFLTAQAEYQANIQMFNMVANMTATSLKSLGEGLTSIARKQ